MSLVEERLELVNRALVVASALKSLADEVADRQGQ